MTKEGVLQKNNKGDKAMEYITDRPEKEADSVKAATDEDGCVMDDKRYATDDCTAEKYLKLIDQAQAIYEMPSSDYDNYLKLLLSHPDAKFNSLAVWLREQRRG